MAILRSILSVTAVLGLASAASVPSGDGFPNPNNQQLLDISMKAGGLVPNGATPSKLGPVSTIALQLITANELFESAYFNSLLYNITNHVQGYEVSGNEKMDGEKVFETIVAQEELHAISAAAVLKGANAKFIPTPCKYKFPVNTLKDSISLAETFTALVLGALQDANYAFASEGLAPLVPIITSITGQEGEQNGLYRVLLDRVPSESPFLTRVPAPFAYSALQMFVESCPYDISAIDLPVFPGLMVNGGAIALIGPKDQNLRYSADLSSSEAAKKYVGGSGSGLWLTYTTGQQLPFSVPICDVKWEGSTISFTAVFPFREHVMEGFSHAALTTTDKFASVDDIPNDTLAAPGVIQVNDSL